MEAVGCTIDPGQEAKTEIFGSEVKNWAFGCTIGGGPETIEFLTSRA